MNNEMQEAFENLEQMRNAYFASLEFNCDIHTRVLDDKWSIAESIYHCYKLLKLTRLGLQAYLPFARPIINLVPCDNQNNDMPNIYSGKTMKAPFILIPGNVDHLEKGDLRNLLEVETRKVQNLVKNLTQKEIYCIRLPDPVPNYPNIIQGIKLLEIHERHHYEVVIERQQANH